MSLSPQNISEEEQMIGLISKHQTALHGYIFALIRDSSLVDDILQETNIILWRKVAEYDATQPFLPWACSIAWFQVKAARRDISRDRLVFSESIMALLSKDAAQTDVYLPSQREMALADCVGKLNPRQKELIKSRYIEDLGVSTIAEQVRRPAAAISRALYVIRHNLKKCVDLKMVTDSKLK